MKIRYLRLERKQRRILRNLALKFPQDPLLSAQPLSFRFFVGLNGSGKTTLLRTLAEIFVTLDRDGQPPAFPLWLAYDLKVDEKIRTVYLCSPKSHAPTLVIFDNSLPSDTNWEYLTAIDPHSVSWPHPIYREFKRTLPDGNVEIFLPSGGEFNLFLPSAMIAYTSGQTQEWKTIFDPAELMLDETSWSVLTPEDERPSNWTAERENELRQRTGESQSLMQAASPETLAAQFIRPSNSFLINTSQLSLAAALIMLKHLADQGKDESLQKILNELHMDMNAPLAFSLWVNLESARLTPTQAVIFADLMKLATTVVSESEPSQWRQLVFDPLARVSERDYNANPAPKIDAETKVTSYPGPQRIGFGDLTINAILELLGGEGGKIFDVFRTLSDWQQNSLVRDVRLILRKNTFDKDILLFDWLSDGERMLLGRIALFYLLQEKEDALLILDEPETHFNDAWKRRLVDMLDDALRDGSHQIVVSTHSSILLSDVFNTEITVLGLDGTIYEPSSGTFGTLPSEIMRNIFGTDNPVGDRAREFLDAVLTLVEYPELANRLWRELDKEPEPQVGNWVTSRYAFGEILKIFNEREQEEKLPHRSPYQWLRLFQGLHRRARVKGEVTLANVLEMLFDYVGAGYYQFELRRQHRRLTSAGENATPG